MKGRTIFIAGIAIVLLLACLLLLVLWVTRPYVRELQAIRQATSARPLVHILSPQQGEQVAVGGALAVQVNATARGDRLARLELWADGQLVGMQEGGEFETLAAAFGWQPTAAGAHTLVARAYNSRGNSGQAAVSLEAVAESDADRDGVADSGDSCAEQYGPLDNGGCPIGAAPGGAAGDLPAPSPLEQALQEAESPPVPQDSLGGVQAGGQAGGGQAGGGQEEQGGGVDNIPDPQSSGLLDVPYPVARRWGAIGRIFGLGDEQPQPEPAIPLEVEFLDLRASPGLSRLYCFLSLTDDDVRERVPQADGASLTFSGEGWNIADYLGGEHGPRVEIPEDGLLPLRLYCLGDDQSLGEVVREHSSADWNRQPITAAAGGGPGGSFEVTYRICPLDCELMLLDDLPEFIPPPVNTHFGSPAFGEPYFPDHLTLMWNMPWDEPRWGWEDQAVTIDGFRFYLNGNLIDEEADPNRRDHFLPNNLLTPPCGQESLLTITAYRGPLGEEGSAESAPASYGWLIGPGCQGEDWIQIWSGPAGGTLPEASATFGLNYHYASDHGDDVRLTIYPLYQGQPVPGFQASSVEVEHGDGAAFIRLYSTSTQARETNQLMLAFLSPRYGRQGGIFYSRIVDLPLTWPGSAPDLVIQNVEFFWFSEDGYDVYFSPPAAGQPLMPTGQIRFDIANRGWRPAEGFHVRLTDAGGTVVTETLIEGPVQPGVPGGWLWELPNDELIRLYSLGCTLQVDSQNQVAEADEGNNLYPFSVRYLRLTFQTLHTGDWPGEGGDEFTSAPSIYLWAATSPWTSFRWWEWPHLWIDGGYVDNWVEGFFHPHAAGIVLRPNTEYSIADILSWFTVDVSECPPPGQPCHYYEDGLCNSWESHNPCRAVQDNTSAPTSNVVYIQAPTDGPLSLFARVEEMDCDWGNSYAERFDRLCYASRDVYPFELEALPATFTVGSLAENGCQVEVVIEEVR